MQVRIDKSNQARIAKLKGYLSRMTQISDICTDVKLINALLADKLICELRRYEKKP